MAHEDQRDAREADVTGGDRHTSKRAEGSDDPRHEPLDAFLRPKGIRFLEAATAASPSAAASSASGGFSAQCDSTSKTTQGRVRSIPFGLHRHRPGAASRPLWRPCHADTGLVMARTLRGKQGFVGALRLGHWRTAGSRRRDADPEFRALLSHASLVASGRHIRPARDRERLGVTANDWPWANAVAAGSLAQRRTYARARL
jgi:hypothetical protein